MALIIGQNEILQTLTAFRLIRCNLTIVQLGGLGDALEIGRQDISYCASLTLQLGSCVKVEVTIGFVVGRRHRDLVARVKANIVVIGLVELHVSLRTLRAASFHSIVGKGEVLLFVGEVEVS